MQNPLWKPVLGSVDGRRVPAAQGGEIATVPRVSEPARWGLRRNLLDLMDKVHLARPAVQAYELSLAAARGAARRTDGPPQGSASAAAGAEQTEPRGRESVRRERPDPDLAHPRAAAREG